MENQDNLFYLIGFQRSGTTLLSHLLDKHPQILCIDEPEISKRIVFKQYDLLRDITFDSIKKSLEYYNVDPACYSELVDRFLARDIDEHSFLMNSYALFDKKNALRVGVKEVCDLTSLRHDYLRKLISFHRGRFKIILIQRDIKGVVCSFMKLGFFPPGKRKVNGFNLKRFAKQYIKALNYINKNIRGKEVYSVSFESILLEPKNELQGVCLFLGVDSSDQVMTDLLRSRSRGTRIKYDGIRTEVRWGWKEMLRRKEIGWLNRLYDKKVQKI